MSDTEREKLFARLIEARDTIKEMTGRVEAYDEMQRLLTRALVGASGATVVASIATVVRGALTVGWIAFACVCMQLILMATGDALERRRESACNSRESAWDAHGHCLDALREMPAKDGEP